MKHKVFLNWLLLAFIITSLLEPDAAYLSFAIIILFSLVSLMNDRDSLAVVGHGYVKCHTPENSINKQLR